MSLMKRWSQAFQLSVLGNDAGRRFKLFLVGLVVLCNPIFLQAQSATARSEQQSISISDDDFAIIAQEIKSLDDPSFRAFLRARILGWLPRDGDKLRLQNVLLVASESLADIKAHEEQIGSATAAWLRESLIRSTTRWSPSEANALALKYPLRSNEQAKANPVKELTSALDRLNDPKTSKQAIESATKTFLKAKIPPAILFGELLQLDKNKSPHLQQVLAAVISLEESQTGAFPLHFLNLFRLLYLKNTTPTELQMRFLSSCVKATRLSPVAFNDPMVRGPAIELLALSLPYIERLVPAQYPEAAGRLQELNSGNLSSFKNRQAAENRISKSDRPLEQVIAEAEETNDKLFKRDLLERAARMAQKAGKWRQAIDLMVSRDSDEDAKKDCAIHSVRDEFLHEIVGSTLRDPEMEISEYAVSKMQCPIERSNALRGIAVRHYELRDIVRGEQMLGAAAKFLVDAEDSIGKAQSSLELAAAFQKFDTQNALAAFRSAVASINKVPSPTANVEKQSYSLLLPLAEDVIKVFRTLARHDRGASLALSADIRLEELRASATAGINSNPKP